jgi:hypothetical protein
MISLASELWDAKLQALEEAQTTTESRGCHHEPWVQTKKVWSLLILLEMFFRPKRNKTRPYTFTSDVYIALR